MWLCALLLQDWPGPGNPFPLSPPPAPRRSLACSHSSKGLESYKSKRRLRCCLGRRNQILCNDPQTGACLSSRKRCSLRPSFPSLWSRTSPGDLQCAEPERSAGAGGSLPSDAPGMPTLLPKWVALPEEHPFLYFLLRAFSLWRNYLGLWLTLHCRNSPFLKLLKPNAKPRQEGGLVKEVLEEDLRWNHSLFLQKAPSVTEVGWRLGCNLPTPLSGPPPSAIVPLSSTTPSTDASVDGPKIPSPASEPPRSKSSCGIGHWSPSLHHFGALGFSFCSFLSCSFFWFGIPAFGQSSTTCWLPCSSRASWYHFGHLSTLPWVPLEGSSKLVGSKLCGADRVRRAFLAGQWGKAARDKRVPSPNRTLPIELKNRFYVVLSGGIGLDRPTVFNSSASYWAAHNAIGTSLPNSPAISHGFPSQTEARVYLAGAEVVDFDIKQRWWADGWCGAHSGRFGASVGCTGALRAHLSAKWRFGWGHRDQRSCGYEAGRGGPARCFLGGRARNRDPEIDKLGSEVKDGVVLTGSCAHVGTRPEPSIERGMLMEQGPPKENPKLWKVQKAQKVKAMPARNPSRLARMMVEKDGWTQKAGQLNQKAQRLHSHIQHRAWEFKGYDGMLTFNDRKMMRSSLAMENIEKPWGTGESFGFMVNVKHLEPHQSGSF